VRINRVEVPGFGRLRELDWALLPGLNVVLGDNEAGKSTLQQAILAGLFGFHEGPRALASETQAQQHYAPWGGGPYRCAIELQLDAGGAYRLERCFERDSELARVYELPSGRDITSEWGFGRHSSLSPQAQALRLGTSRQVFLRSAFVSQGDLYKVAEPGKLAEALAIAVDNLGGDVSAEMAAKALDDAYKKKVGGERAQTMPLPLARNCLDDLQGEIARVRGAQEALAAAAKDRLRLETEVEDLRGRIAVLAGLLARARLSQLDEAMATVAEADAALARDRALAENVCAYSCFPSEPREPVEKLAQSIESLSREQARLAAQATACDPESLQMRERLETLRHEAGRLESARGLPADLERPLRARRAEVERLRGEVSGLRLGEHTERPPTRRSLALPPLLAGLALAMAVGAAFTLAGSAALAAAAAALSIAGGLGLAYLLGRPIPGSGRPEAGALPAKERELATALGSLAALLRTAAVGADDVDAGLAVFEERLAQRHRLDACEATLRVLQAQLELLSVPSLAAAAMDEQVRAARTELAGLLAQAGLPNADLEQARRDFLRSCERRAEYQRISAAVSASEARRRAALAGRSPDDLRDEREQLAARCGHPQECGSAPGESLAATDARKRSLDEELAAKLLRIAELGGALAQGVAQYRPRAEIEEDIAACEVDVARLTCFGDVLLLAKQTVEEAAAEVHRGFAPRLNQELGAALATVTDGRYREAYVDPSDFHVRVKAPESGELVDCEQLSRGAREQASILLRLAVARLLSATGETSLRCFWTTPLSTLTPSVRSAPCVLSPTSAISIRCCSSRKTGQSRAGARTTSRRAAGGCTGSTGRAQVTSWTRTTSIASIGR